MRLSVAQVVGDCASQVVSFDHSGQALIWCPFHNKQFPPKDGHSKSFSLSSAGEFYCHSCSEHGKDIVGFIQQFRHCSMLDALAYLYDRYCGPFVSGKVVRECYDNLKAATDVYAFMMQHKGLSKTTIERRWIGFDGQRITVPIPGPFGQFVNMLRYDHTGKRGAKVLPWRKGYGEARLYPIDTFEHSGMVVFCEGWRDALVARQKGLAAVTITGGAGTWKAEWLPFFRGKDVVVVFDVNDKVKTGERGAQKIAGILRPIAESLTVVTLPLKERGGDLCDFFLKHGRSALDFLELVKEQRNAEPQPASSPHKWSRSIRLADALMPENIHVPVQISCTIAGKMDDGYAYPNEVRITCGGDMGDACESCVLHPAHDQQLEVPITEKDVPRLIDCSTKRRNEVIRQLLGIPSECEVTLKETAFETLEGLVLTPEIEYEDVTGTNTNRFALSREVGLEVSRPYAFESMVVTKPRSQRAVIVVNQAEPAYVSLDQFEMTEDLASNLSVFSPKTLDPETIQRKLDELYHHFEVNVTHIYQRPDLHQAVDLVFHSPLSFEFNNELVRKGWLECVVAGDTRTGKGYVAEGFVRYYKLGEVVSGENCSFAGLVGGAQKVGDNWVVTAGRIVVNDRRLVVIDETSAMPVEDIERMSRVRSEGIAEITKIVTRRFHARTRLIWLGNPRTGRAMNTYNFGVLAVKELVGKLEDVARFDYALTVATDEVPATVINRPSKKAIKTPYTADLCRQLILWVWSRAPHQICFTAEATRRILSESVILADKYHPGIPLIQGENIRIKLAKIAAAVAGRIFSNKEDGEVLLITEGCVEAAVHFLHACYRKRSMAYNQFSVEERRHSTLADQEDVERLISNLGSRAIPFVNGLLDITQVSVRDVQNLSGAEKDEAQRVLSALIALRALRKRYSFYVKTLPFAELLRKLAKRYRKHGAPKEMV